MIKLLHILRVCIIAILLLYGCSAPEKLSKKYYLLHEKELKQINASYNQLYAIKPFILGFTDAKYKHYSLEVSTDSIRYVYNTSIMDFSVADSIIRFGLDSSRISRLGRNMKRSKCICVARHFFYWDDKEYAANWLFFRQARSGLFKERKYHVLIFFKESLPGKLRDDFIANQGLQQLEDNVFYTVSNRFK